MQLVTATPLEGTISAIPAKAHAHRALIAAALAKEASVLILNRSSKDIAATMASLNALGAKITKEKDKISVLPINQNTPASERANQTGAITPNESGTTLRLLLPVAASLGFKDVNVDAKGRLPNRPLEPMLGELKRHGISFTQDKPPFTMQGSLTNGNYEMVGNVSSQFFSGLLLAAPQIGKTTIKSMGALQSKDYVTLTITVMEDFGVPVKTEINANKEDIFTVPDEVSFKGQQNYAIEGDWSNASVWLVAAALTGKAISITGLNKTSVQADKRILDIIQQVGCQLNWEGNTLTCTGKATKTLDLDLEQCPDLFPILGTLATGIVGESHFRNGSRLRLKESDRLEMVAQLLRNLGATVTITGDDVHITGTGHLVGGNADCANDHRLVMAGALAALISKEDVILKDSEAISKSYPDFFDDWNLLGGKTHGL